MAERYVIRPRAAAEAAEELGTACVILLDDGARPTGLVNAQGVPIYRVRPAVGFRGKGE